MLLNLYSSFCWSCSLFSLIYIIFGQKNGAENGALWVKKSVMHWKLSQVRTSRQIWVTRQWEWINCSDRSIDGTITAFMLVLQSWYCSIDPAVLQWTQETTAWPHWWGHSGGTPRNRPVPVASALASTDVLGTKLPTGLVIRRPQSFPGFLLQAHIRPGHVIGPGGYYLSQWQWLKCIQ